LLVVGTLIWQNPQTVRLEMYRLGARKKLHYETKR
jgi:hypothetical protein